MKSELASLTLGCPIMYCIASHYPMLLSPLPSSTTSGHPQISLFCLTETASLSSRLDISQHHGLERVCPAQEK